MTQPRSNAGHDQNHVTTLIGVSSADGFTPVPIEVDPSTGEVLISQPSLLIDRAFDALALSNADANGNYQTMAYKTGGLSGTTQRTLTLTFDANSNITSIERS